MEVLSPNSAILEKTRELCSLILQSGEYQENVAKIETFFSTDGAQEKYRSFAALGEELHEKQQAGTITEADISGYEASLQELKSNEVTSNFMDAEASLNGMLSQISKLVGKTLELGRLPNPDDLDSGCCGGGGGGGGNSGGGCGCA
ncbi:MAG: YlbF family regulator [Verrucomicrobiota bacterium]